MAKFTILLWAVFTASFALADESLPFVNLRHLPGVAATQQNGPKQSTSRIIHILDWHYVDGDKFAADLRSQGEITDAEIERQFIKLLQEVEAIQTQQMAILRHLIAKHGLKAVRIEGMTERDTNLVAARVKSLQRMGVEVERYEAQATAAAKEGLDTTALDVALAKLHAWHRRNLLQFGAAGRLAVAGELAAVLPLDDAAAYKAADPLRADGTIVLDQTAIEARQDALVRRLLAQESVSVIILGGAHDLADNIERLSEGQAEYVRVVPKGWNEIVQREFPDLVVPAETTDKDSTR